MTAILRTASPIVLVVNVPSVFAPFSQPSRSCQSTSMLNPPRSPPRRCTPTAGYCAWNASIAPSMSVSLIIPFISTMRIRSASFTLRLIIVTPAPSHRCVYPFRVRWTTERPKDAFVAVEYNGYWFSSPKPTSRASQDLIFLSRFPFAGSGTSSRTTGVNPASFLGARTPRSRHLSHADRLVVVCRLPHARHGFTAKQSNQLGLLLVRRKRGQSGRPDELWPSPASQISEGDQRPPVVAEAVVESCGQLRFKKLAKTAVHRTNL